MTTTTTIYYHMDKYGIHCFRGLPTAHWWKIAYDFGGADYETAVENLKEHYGLENIEIIKK